MNILVLVKHVIDESELKADSHGAPQLEGAPTKMSNFDKNAIEAALQLKESAGGTVSLLTMGASESKRTLREGMAMGAEKAFLVVCRQQDHDSLTSSYYIGRAIKATGPFDLIVCSEGSSDTYSGQLPAMVAEWLQLPYLGNVRKLEMVHKGLVRCEENAPDRVDIVEAELPAVVSVTIEANTPRYPKLLDIMQSSKKPLEEMGLEQLRGSDAPEKAVSVIGVILPPTSRKRVVFEGAAEESARHLVDALSKEGVLKR